MVGFLSEPALTRNRQALSRGRPARATDATGSRSKLGPFALTSLAVERPRADRTPNRVSDWSRMKECHDSPNFSRLNEVF